MEFDLHSNIEDRVALVNQAITSNTTTVGIIIDSAGFESLEFLIQAGTVTDGDYALLLEEGDDAALSDAATLSVDLTLGALTGFVPGGSLGDTAIRVGSIGKDRYHRLSLVSTNVSTGGDFSALAVLGNPHTAPVGQ